MPSSLFSDLDRPSLEEQRALQLAFELSMLGLTEPLAPASSGPVSPNGGLSQFGGGVVSGLDDARSKKSQNMTECVPVPSSEHVAEIVGRQGKYRLHNLQSFSKNICNAEEVKKICYTREKHIVYISFKFVRLLGRSIKLFAFFSIFITIVNFCNFLSYILV